MANNLTNEASLGYLAGDGVPCPFLWSSNSAIAWQLGRWLATTGRSTPRNVRMSRGFHIRANDMLMKWNDNGTFERIN